MKQDATVSFVENIMTAFAGLTGLSPVREAPRRYLWTDSFAVCNFLELFRRTGDEKYRNLALRLLELVHNTLGRHRADDPRTGWISGLDEEEGKLHPTVGGLRIGKKMNERALGAPLDDRLEWDRDGQYYHYLTKWMHALNRVSRVTEDEVYNRWAVELAKAVHAKFVYTPSYGGEKRMYWKMSIDLSYPQVTSMGHHDPLDGLVTYSQLQATLTKSEQRAPHLDLTGEIADMLTICKGKNWATDDPLGIGGLLADAYKAVLLMVSGSFKHSGLPADLLKSSRLGLDSYVRTTALNLSADYRLAFRELGLSIGLRAVGRLKELAEKEHVLFGKIPELDTAIESLMRYIPLIERIESFWLEPIHRESESWKDHLDINTVMLATSLSPDGYLSL